MVNSTGIYGFWRNPRCPGWDLVNREEFDSQTQILARTRAGVEEMETRVAQLSEQLAALEAAQER